MRASTKENKKFVWPQCTETMSTSVPLGLQQCTLCLILRDASTFFAVSSSFVISPWKSCHHERCKEREHPWGTNWVECLHTPQKNACVYTTKGMQQHPALSWPASRYGGGGFIELKYFIFPSLYLSNIGRACIPNERTWRHSSLFLTSCMICRENPRAPHSTSCPVSSTVHERPGARALALSFWHETKCRWPNTARGSDDIISWQSCHVSSAQLSLAYVYSWGQYYTQRSIEKMVLLWDP